MIGDNNPINDLNQFVLENEGLSNENKRIFAATGKIKRGGATTKQVISGFKTSIFKPSEKNQILTLYDFLYSQSNGSFPFDTDIDDYNHQLNKLRGDSELS